jgi:hypothetical protein
MMSADLISLCGARCSNSLISAHRFLPHMPEVVLCSPFVGVAFCPSLILVVFVVFVSAPFSWSTASG